MAGTIYDITKVLDESSCLNCYVLVLGQYINIAIYCQSTNSISMSICPTYISIYHFYQLSNAYHNYWVHILHICSSSFTHLWSVVWSENVQLCEPVLCILLH